MSFGMSVVQALGFLIQTLPIAVLCFVPFSDRDLRFSRKMTLAISVAGLFALSVGFAIMTGQIFSPDGSGNDIMRTASNLYMNASLVIAACFFFFNVRAAVSKRFIVLMMLIHYAAVLFTVSSVIVGQFTENMTNPVLVIYGRYNSVVNPLLLLVTFPPVYLFLKRIVSFDLLLMKSALLRRSCIFTMLALLFFCVCVFMLNNFKYYYGFTGEYLLLFLLAFILTDAILYYIMFAEMRLSFQTLELQKQLRSFDEQYRQIDTAIEESRRARHDMRHHLNVINTLARENRTAELADYLEKYTAAYQELEQQPLSGYTALDTILRYYLERCTELEIPVETRLQPVARSLGFDVIDMTVLLGNLMENAIEGCQRVPEQATRYIQIWVQQTDASLLIQVENSCETGVPEQPEFSEKASFASKKNTTVRGCGIGSIRTAAKKYGGSAEFKRTGGVFYARVVLNLPY